MTEIKETEINYGVDSFQIVSYIMLKGKKWVVIPVEDYKEMLEQLEKEGEK